MRGERQKIWLFAWACPRITTRMVLEQFPKITQPEAARALREMVVIGNFTVDEKIGPRGLRFYRCVRDNPPEGRGAHKRLPNATRRQRKDVRAALRFPNVANEIKPWQFEQNSPPDIAEEFIAHRITSLPVVHP